MEVTIKTLLVAATMLVVCCSAASSDVQTESEPSSTIEHISVDLSELVKNRGIEITELSILIDKSDYILSVIHKDTVVKSYPVVLGYNPTGDKLQEGDYKTPEGTFGVRSKYAHANWKYFIWIDYPNEESWKRFDQRKKDGTIGKNAKIGGEIGIHGTPEGGDYLIDDKINWTFGCISLSRKDVAEIYPYFHRNIKIVIRA